MATKKKAKTAAKPAAKNQMGIKSIFPVNIVVADWGFDGHKAYEADLSKALYRMRSRDPQGIRRSNAHGTWHSKDTVLTETGEHGDMLKQMFYRAFATLAQKHAVSPHPEDRYEMRLAAWAMMYGDRGIAAPHTHPNCHFSGVYYVDAGEPQKLESKVGDGKDALPGTLEFLNGVPRYGLLLDKHVLEPGCRIEPQTGLMVVFPSLLPHWVYPTVGDYERIAVACNATVSKYIPHTEK